jgi:hypothetical protein
MCAHFLVCKRLIKVLRNLTIGVIKGNGQVKVYLGKKCSNCSVRTFGNFHAVSWL